MVQVDVFWSYGLGATFAVAGSRQLLARRKREKEQPTHEPRRWTDPYLMRALLFLALVFVPSGVWLVWAFPSWETMHAGDRDMPVWLVTAFAVTNVTQGLLGYLVSEWLIARGRTYLAWLQVLAGYFGMFAILIHGWDGTGYQRFFSPTREDFLAWDGDWSAWLTSDVALSLYGMGVVLVPVLLLTVAHWHVAGYRLGPASAARPGRAAVMALTLGQIFGVALGLALVVHLLLVWLGTVVGALAALTVIAATLAPGGPVHRFYRAFGLPEAPATPQPERTRADTVGAAA